MNRITAILTFLALGFCAVTPAAADWSDDFTGGVFHQPWVFFDNSGNAPPDATTVDPSAEFLALSGRVDQLLVGNVDQFVVGLVGFPLNPAHGIPDVVVRADVTSLSNATLAGGGAPGNNDSIILARVGNNGTDSYLLALDFFDGGLDLVRVDPGPTLVGLDDSSVFGFNNNDTYTLELTAVGNALTGRAYDQFGTLVGTVAATDNTYTNGWAGLGSAINDNGGIGPGGSGRTLIAAAFDNASARAFVVPEPSTFVLMAMAAAGAMAFARRRKG